MVTAESPASIVGHITLDRKRAGKPIAGNRHDGFEVAGAGTQLTVWLLRHSQRKRGATDRLNLRSMAPVLDPTRPCQQTTRIVSPMNLIESKSQNGSEMVKNFAIIVQGDLRVRQGTVTVNVFRCNDFRPKYQLAGYLH